MIEDSVSPITGDPPHDGGAAHYWTDLRSVLPRPAGVVGPVVLRV